MQGTNDLDASFDSLPDSTLGDEPLKEEYSNEPDKVMLSEDDSETEYNFEATTTEQDPKIRKAEPTPLKFGIKCQRLGQSGWNNLKFAETGKQFQATPAFCALIVNNILAGASPKLKFADILETFDLTLGAITNGLIQQRIIFEDTLKTLPQEAARKIRKKFLSPSSDFKNNSEALLQYVCGRRADVLKQRRNILMPRNKDLKNMIQEIPPSDSHLFEEKALSDLIKEQGGIQKFFPSKRNLPGLGHRQPTRARGTFHRTPQLPQNYSQKQISRLPKRSFANQSSSRGRGNVYQLKRPFNPSQEKK